MRLKSTVGAAAGRVLEGRIAPPAPCERRCARTAPDAGALAAVGLVSCASLFHQLSLTRVFSVSGWYHYIFMVVSVALLGYGASGTALAVTARRPAVPGAQTRAARSTLFTWCGALFGLSAVVGHVVTSALPFDAFRVALDPWQLGRLGVHYVALAVPFFFAGLIVGGYLGDPASSPSAVYAASLAGSAAGCLAALPAMGHLPEGALPLAAGLLGLGATLAMLMGAGPRRSALRPGVAAVAAAAVGAVAVLASGGEPFPVAMSPYKSLSQAMKIPSARLVATLRSPRARVDVVQSPAIHYAPGLSHRYEGPLPAQVGVATDGDDLIGVASTGSLSAAFLDAMPFSAAFELGRLRTGGGTALVLRPGAGFEAEACRRRGVAVVVADDNPLAEAALERAGRPLLDGRVRVRRDPRGELARRGRTLDAVFFPLVRSYTASAAGSFCLAADHLATFEAYLSALRAVRPDGVVVVHTWLHNPPTDSIRVAATLIAACERQGLDPRRCLVGLRSLTTAVWVLRRGDVTPDEKTCLRRFCERWGFDLMWLDGMRAEEANRFIRVTQPADFQIVSSLLARSAGDRARVFADYPFDVAPVTDDRPFAASFFKLSQVPWIARAFGKAWLPLGGAGFLVFPALTLVSLVASAAFVAPAVRAAVRRTSGKRRPIARATAYAAFLGAAYLFVELPVIQKLGLAAGDPTRAFSVGLAVLLGTSGVGAAVSARMGAAGGLRGRAAVFALACAGGAATFPLLYSAAMVPGMVLPGWARLGLAGVMLCPLGFVMGAPFPLGLAAFASGDPLVAAACWAANGCASVVSGIVAQVVVMLAGYTAAMWVGAAFYILAALVAAFPAFPAFVAFPALPASPGLPAFPVFSASPWGGAAGGRNSRVADRLSRRAERRTLSCVSVWRGTRSTGRKTGGP